MKYIFKIGLDISTKNCGYAVILNDKKVLVANTIYFNKYGYTFGDQLCNSEIDNVCVQVAQAVKRIIEPAIKKHCKNNAEMNKWVNKNIKIIAGVENTIVSYGKNMVISRKLTLFSGAIIFRLRTILDLIFLGGVPNTTFKIISANEWKLRAIPKTHGNKEYNPKKESIRAANVYLSTLHSTRVLKDDNTADALNLARFVDVARDIDIVKKEARQRKLGKRRSQREIRNYELKMEKLLYSASIKKVNHLAKIKNAKKSKFNYDDEVKKELVEFLTKAQLKTYRNCETQIQEIKEYLHKAQENIIKGNNNEKIN